MNGQRSGMIANRRGQPDLGLPHALAAALAASVEKKDHRPLFMVVVPPFFWHIDLVAVGGVIELQLAIQEARFLLMAA